MIDSLLYINGGHFNVQETNNPALKNNLNVSFPGN